LREVLEAEEELARAKKAGAAEEPEDIEQMYLLLLEPDMLFP
jgi:hypothetical protein|tara:strand:- start:373 stop:498 length:126 start_codon:yes stop_codon:yes gene_type:complete